MATIETIVPDPVPVSHVLSVSSAELETLKWALWYLAERRGDIRAKPASTLYELVRKVNT